MKTLYAITHINRDGYRILTNHNTGQYHYATMKEAKNHLKNFNKNNSDDILISVFGAQALKTFEIRAIECYAHGDATGIFWD